MSAPLSNTNPDLKTPSQVHTADFSPPPHDIAPIASSTIAPEHEHEPDHPSPAPAGSKGEADNVGLGLQGPFNKAGTGLSREPDPRQFNDENSPVVIFRRAVGINSTLSGAKDPASLEAGRRKAVGIYAEALREVRRKKWEYHLLSWLINACHFVQIVIGASLTALGPNAGGHVIAITLLGAINTVIAGVLAFIKGQGLPDRLFHDQAEFRRLQDWIEEHEALLAVGVIGGDRKEVGALVQTAFKKYNAAKQCEESNMPENYVRPPESGQSSRPVSQGSATPPIHPVRSPSPFH